MNKTAKFKKISWDELQSQDPQEEKAFPLIIDLRSEGEYALGHITGAKNLPLLSNEERHEVGYTYKNVGKQEAVELGLEIFAKKAQAFLRDFEKILNNQKHKPSQITLYCWRGGMRSNFVTLFISSFGYKNLRLLEGGYKNYRKSVLSTLSSELLQHEFLVLHGLTGSGKTEIIQELMEENLVGCLDFEKLAKHRGSAFGDFNQKQSIATQQQFENDLYSSYLEQKHHKILLVEIESRLGQVNLHPKLRQKTISSPMLLISRDYEERINSLVKEYTCNWSEETEILFLERLSLLKEKLSRETISKLEMWIKEKNFRLVTDTLLKDHYDKVYGKSIKKYAKQTLNEYNISSQKPELISYIKDYIKKES